MQFSDLETLIEISHISLFNSRERQFLLLTLTLTLTLTGLQDPEPGGKQEWLHHGVRLSQPRPGNSQGGHRAGPAGGAHHHCSPDRINVGVDGRVNNIYCSENLK